MSRINALFTRTRSASTGEWMENFSKELPRTSKAGRAAEAEFFLPDVRTSLAAGSRVQFKRRSRAS